MNMNRIVEGRRTAYASCAARYSAAATQDSIYGDDCSCQNNARATAYWWAQDVMARYPINGEDCGCQCVTEEFACEVIKMMDPSCVECACGDRPATCDITQDYTVYQSADAADQSILPNVAGRTTLIISNVAGAVNGWSQNVGKIATNDGAGNFTYLNPASGSIVYSALTNEYYITYTGGAGPLYPVINGSLVGTTLTLLSSSPQVHAVAGRQIAIEYSDDGITWTGGFVGLESAFAGNYSITVTGDPIMIRARYIYGELDCKSQDVNGVIPPPVSLKRSFEFPFDSGVQYGTLQKSGTPFMCTDWYLDGPWTFAFYVKMSSGPQSIGVRPVFGQFKADFNYPLEIYLNLVPNSIIVIGSNGLGATFFAPSLPDNQWIHIAFVNTTGPLDTTGLSVYVNGVQAITAAPSSVISPSPGTQPPPIGVRGLSFNAGSAITQSSYPDYVRMAEVYSCNTARSQSDIQNILMTGTVDANDSTWGRTMYLKPIDSDVTGIDGVSAQNFNSLLNQSDSYLFTGLFSTDSPI